MQMSVVNLFLMERETGWSTPDSDGDYLVQKKTFSIDFFWPWPWRFRARSYQHEGFPVRELWIGLLRLAWFHEYDCCNIKDRGWA